MLHSLCPISPGQHLCTPSLVSWWYSEGDCAGAHHKTLTPTTRPRWLPVFHGSLKKFLSLFHHVYYAEFTHVATCHISRCASNTLLDYESGCTCHSINFVHVHVYYAEFTHVATCPTVGCYMAVHVISCFFPVYIIQRMCTYIVLSVGGLIRLVYTVQSAAGSV